MNRERSGTETQGERKDREKEPHRVRELGTVVCKVKNRDLGINEGNVVNGVEVLEAIGLALHIFVE